MSNPIAASQRPGVRVLGLGFALLLALLCAAAVVVYLAWHGRPAHWDHERQRLAELSGEQRQAISESLRNRLIQQWSSFGDRDPFKGADPFGQETEIEIPYDQLNTWIQTEGIDLLAEVDIEVPKTATTAMIDSPGDGLLRISFEVITQGVEQVITLSFAVSIEKDGTLTSTLMQATAGKLPLPIATAIELVASQADEGVLLDLMQGTPIDPVQLPIDTSDSGRDGRIVGLEVTPTALILTRRAVARKQNRD